MTPASLQRTEVAATRTGRHIYVIGGFERQTGATTAAVERYDTKRDTWTRVADMPLGRWREQPPMRKPRGGTGAATVGGRIVVAGGEETAGTIREVELFNPASLRSSSLVASPRLGTRRWRRLDDMPTPRPGLV